MLKNKCHYFIYLSLVVLCFGCRATMENSQAINSPSQINIDANNQNQQYNFNQVTQEQRNTPEKSDVSKKSLQDCNEQSQFIYKNISFRCISLLASHVEVTEFSEMPLEYEVDKPDYVHPSYLSFKFINDAENQNKELREINR